MSLHDHAFGQVFTMHHLLEVLYARSSRGPDRVKSSLHDFITTNGV